MLSNGRMVFLVVVLVALIQTTWGQRAVNWRVYKMADGLPESGCLSVTISPQGKVLARHLNASSFSELDGYSVIVRPAPENSTRIYGSPGGQLWTASPAGLLEFKDAAWVAHPAPQIPPSALASPLTEPLQLFPVRQDLVLCLLHDALREFDYSRAAGLQTRVLRNVTQTHLQSFSTMSAERNGGLWIAGARGLAKVPGPLRNLKPDTEWQEFLPDETLQLANFREPREDTRGVIALLADSATNHQKMLVSFDGKNWTMRKAPGARIRHAWRGPDGNWWASSFNALFHADSEQADLVETDEISARQYFDVAVEPNGSFWLATSDGLFRYALMSWRSESRAGKSSPIIHCMTGDSQDRLWFVTSGGLELLQKDSHETYRFGEPVAQDLQAVRSVFILKNGTILLDGEEQIFLFNPSTRVFMPAPLPSSEARLRALGSLKDGRVCFQAWRTNTPTKHYSLLTFDGAQFQSLPCPAPDPGLGSNLTALVEAQNDDLWLGAEHGTACFHANQWKIYNAADKTSPDSPVAFLELPDGKIWCATIDKIWQFDGNDWSELRRSFDRINSIVRTRRDGSIWVASNGGLHRFHKEGGWVENGIEEGLPSTSVRSLLEDQRGRLWAGTTHGLSFYDPEADRDPPQTIINRPADPFTGQQTDIRDGGAITITFNAQDKWKQTTRDRLLYSSRLDDGPFSLFQDARQAVLPDLSAGKHSFQVRAMDRNCNIEPSQQLDFAVISPWYKETRLVLISLAGLALVLFFAGVAYNRHRQLVRSYAVVEKKVADRTRELEITSRELLHSQKMNALGALAAGIAHDFNNILSIIKGSAQIIEDNLDDAQKVRTRVDRIKTVVEQGAGIVKAMLGFSRESDQQLPSCDLNAVVQDTVMLLGDRFLREVQVAFDPAPNLPVISCPKDFVQQVLLNFIFNAAEAGGTRHQIILSTRQLEKLPSKLILSPHNGNGYISVSVQDFGCGISPENMARIFEPFFTTKALSVRRGTGLGLSMVYELARKMEAGLAVESVVGQGSTFTLVLAIQPVTKSERAS